MVPQRNILGFVDIVTKTFKTLFEKRFSKIGKNIYNDFKIIDEMDDDILDLDITRNKNF